MSSNEFFTPLISEENGLEKEFKKRKNLFNSETIPHRNVEEYIENGWKLDKKLKFRTRMKKEKPFDERLENSFWSLLKVLGYREMNQGRNFKVTIKRPGAEDLTKQIDVFAVDDETVIVAECKASATLKRRQLQKDIEEFANLKSPISRAIKKTYDKKLKIIWMFVTRNIIWSDPDKQRAKGGNIHIVTERDLNYYWTIAKHLGVAAKYQFLAEFLQGQSIPELVGRSLPAIRGKLGGRKFFSFVSTPRELLKISFINHRMLNDPDGAPSYQRLAEGKRLKQIGKFIDKGGFFPTNILLNFIKKPRFDVKLKDESTGIHYGQLYLPTMYRGAWVIDGQHRLYGYTRATEDHLDQNIAVIAFEELSKTDEANLFVEINHEQKSVPKGLLDELEGELKWGSKVPGQRIGAIASRTLSLLASDVNQPFYEKIRAQGEAKSGSTPNLRTLQNSL